MLELVYRASGKNIGINIGHFSEKYRANIGKSSKIKEIIGGFYNCNLYNNNAKRL